MLISLDKLANYSHASDREFDRMRSELARQLTEAGRCRQTDRAPTPIRIEHRSQPADYALEGTVYLVTAAGRDECRVQPVRWRCVRPASCWTVWRADSCGARWTAAPAG